MGGMGGMDQAGAMQNAMATNFPSAAQAGVGSDIMSAPAPNLSDLEASKDHLVNQAAASAAAAVTKQQAPTDNVFKITVTDPVKQGDGMRSYISYKINTKTSLPQYQWKEFSVIHRYSDFVWLQEMLKAKYEHVIIPPLPEKAVTGNFEPTFIQLRRGALEKFLQRVAAHPVLCHSEDLQILLEANNDTLQTAKQQSKKPTGDKQSLSFFQRMSMFGQGISNSMSKLPDEFADPGFEEQKAKIDELKTRSPTCSASPRG